MNINGALSLENYFSIEEILELNTNLKNGFKFIKPELYMKSNNFNELLNSNTFSLFSSLNDAS